MPVDTVPLEVHPAPLPTTVRLPAVALDARLRVMVFEVVAPVMVPPDPE